jgi:hypothetical protein
MQYKRLLWLAALAFLLSSLSEGQGLFWVETTFGRATLRSANTDGSNQQLIALDSMSLPDGITVDINTKTVYWDELRFSGAKFHRIDTNFNATAVMDSQGSAMRGIDIDNVNGKIYWASSNLLTGATIKRANLDGSSIDTLQSFPPGTENPRGVAIDKDAGKIYWTDFDGGAIRRADTIRGADPEDFLTGLDSPSGLVLNQSGGSIYWTEATTIRRANTNGTGITTLVSSLERPVYLALDTSAGTMYWTEIGIPRIRKSALDGSNVQDVPVTVSHPAGIAILPAPTEGVELPGQTLPLEFALEQNYPNPFNPVTIIGYAVAGRKENGGESTETRLVVYDLLGREVALLVNERKQPGRYSVPFDASRLASGVYAYRIQAGSFVKSRTMVLLK